MEQPSLETSHKKRVMSGRPRVDSLFLQDIHGAALRIDRLKSSSRSPSNASPTSMPSVGFPPEAGNIITLKTVDEPDVAVQTAEIELMRKKTQSLFAGGIPAKEVAKSPIAVEMVESDISFSEDEEAEEGDSSSLWHVLYKFISSSKFDSLMNMIKEMHRIIAF